MRRKKTSYPPPKTSTPPRSAPGDDPRQPGGGRSVSIDLTAMAGRPDIVPGLRVRIMSGLYAGEAAIVESIAGGVIPAAVVRTEAGRSRRARTIDLMPEPEEPRP